MIKVWSQAPADTCMPEALLVRVLQSVRRHPWYEARASLATAALKRWNVTPPARVADVGCGWGVNLAALEKAGYRVTGFDISHRILELIDQPGRELIQSDLNQGFPSEVHGTYDACLALDVIEHLDDDRAAVRSMATLLRSGGVCLVSVPALPRLFSEFDQVQGHRRRYLPQSLRAAFAGTGLTVRTIFWWGSWMVPVLYLTRAKTNSRSMSDDEVYARYYRLPPRPIPELMRLAYTLEERVALNGWVPKGTSLFAIAVRSNEAMMRE